MFAALRIPGYPLLWASGWLWNLTRWGTVFLSSYLVNRQTGSPLLVQLVGATFFAPMFFGGMVGGVISDRFDRRRVIARQLLALVPAAALMGVLVLSGHARAWMFYPLVLAVGMGGVLDMTARRALVFEMVGERHITNAMALESMAMQGGNMLGALGGGAMIGLVGPGQAFCAVAVCYALAWLCVRRVPSPVHAAPVAHTAGPPPALRRELAEGMRYVRGEPVIVGALAVTALVNLFYFSHLTLVPVFADRLGVGAVAAGALASAAGLGSLAGSLLIASGRLGRVGRGWLFAGGALLALTALVAFAAVTWFPLAFAVLLLAGTGTAGFGAMQATLVLLTAGPEMRGRAMGILSTAIGMLPFGMTLLGLAAQAAGPAPAVAASAALGFVLVALWIARFPALRRMQ